ncbi:tripartite tricarboxylate transporter permease [Aureimonas fodinaquatilis]|uniref:Tripartite tricarboxylate transporter permease n=2 Tax=Aureimonas fodinaquatilis TaxID=2565783 RepID=A0A5B0E2T9_9HYPH|nr:tripartite tricarboxylate transporter permease [Aureimonas fodinaquatilis]KAA0972642.1 tripartite tricarboxylate transporter permease [Aureimonas fodinaquatilis]
MDQVAQFGMGLLAALQPANLLYALLGCVIGTLVGVLPGVGPVAGIAILLPITFGMDPGGALIMLAAIYYGTMYGGTITSVLMNVPGESASVVTAIDGYQMARKGKAGQALSIAALASFFGGCVATLGIVFLAGPLSKLGLLFGPPEFFALILVGFSLLVGLAGNSVLKALLSAVFGLALTLPGLDPMVGMPRLTFGQLSLMDGLGFVPVLMGLFGISEILLNVEASRKTLVLTPMTSMWLSKEELRRSTAPVLRGTALGFLIGLIPGLGSATSSFAAYALERRVTKRPELFGKGAIEGVASPEAANNATANASLLPLLALGIPGSASVALLMGAFLMNGITPGPFLLRDHAELVWTLVASMIVGNVILLVLNLPLVGLWIKVLDIPYAILFGLIIVFATIGSYAINNSMVDVAVMYLFGAIGYALRKVDIPLAPIALTLVLGPQFEQSLRQSLVLSNGDIAIFFRGPISITLVVLAVVSIVLSAIPTGRSVKTIKEQDSEV